MAGIRAAVSANSIACNTATKTILQLVAPTNQRLMVSAIRLTLDTTAIFADVSLALQTDAGTSSAATPSKLTPGSETLQSTAVKDATGVATTSASHHQVTNRIVEYLFDKDERYPVAGGTRLGVLVTTGGTTNIDVEIEYEE